MLTTLASSPVFATTRSGTSSNVDTAPELGGGATVDNGIDDVVDDVVDEVGGVSDVSIEVTNT